MPNTCTESPLDYRGYRIYARLGTPIWGKSPLSGHTYQVGRLPGRGFLIERIDPGKPAVRTMRHPATLEAAKAEVDFLLKFGAYDHPGEAQDSQRARP